VTQTFAGPNEFDSRLAACFGAFTMPLVYVGNWSVEHGYVNGGFAYVLVFLAVAAFGAGRILSVDAKLEKFDVVYEYGWLRYRLG